MHRLTNSAEDPRRGDIHPPDQTTHDHGGEEISGAVAAAGQGVCGVGEGLIPFPAPEKSGLARGAHHPGEQHMVHAPAVEGLGDPAAAGFVGLGRVEVLPAVPLR